MKVGSCVFPGPCRGRHRSRQSGAVLIISLILLMVLTLLGVSSMTGTSLEEKMASNTQEINQAFQVAETGLTRAFQNSDSWNLAGWSGKSDDPVKDANGTGGSTTTYSSSFIGWSPPPTSSLYSATSFQSANFDLRSAGLTQGSVSTVLHRGAYQIAPRL